MSHVTCTPLTSVPSQRFYFSILINEINDHFHIFLGTQAKLIYMYISIYVMEMEKEFNTST